MQRQPLLLLAKKIKWALGATRNATFGQLELFHWQLYPHTASLCHLPFCHVFGGCQLSAANHQPARHSPSDKGVADNLQSIFFFIKISLGVTHLVISLHYVFRAHNGPGFAQYRPSLLFIWENSSMSSGLPLFRLTNYYFGWNHLQRL